MKSRPLLLLPLLLLTSCLDDQRYVPADAQEDVNPKPMVSQPAVSNARHKVLIAILDSGVDYNHPALQQSVHYELDSKGAVVGAGRDFLANDLFAAPYAAITADVAPHAPEEKKELAINHRKGVNIFLGLHPELSPLLFPKRNQYEELEAKLYHGTHVAGLAAYDNPAIGLLPVRVLPPQPDFSDGEGDKNQEIKLLEALQFSAERGARVVNLSFEGMWKKSESTPENLATYKRITAELRAFMLAHPAVVFVAASGNGEDWRTGRNRAGYPCGISGVPNLLCVAALDRDEDLPAFLSIPLIDDPVVYTFGEHVLSTWPTKMCPLSQPFSDLANDPGTVEDRKEYTDSIAKKLSSACLDHRIDYRYLSGTSMATPMVARLAAEHLIAKPSLSGSEVVQALLARTFDKKFGPLATKVLRVPLPSWYSDPSIVGRVEKPAGLEGDDGRTVVKVSHRAPPQFFEFVLPKHRTRN